MKHTLTKNLLGFLVVLNGLLLPTFFVGCNSNPVTPVHRVDVNNGVEQEIYNKYYKFEGMQVRVTFDNFSVLVLGIEPFEIDTCILFIDNEEIELKPVAGIAYTNRHSLDLVHGGIYNILLEINDVTYETDFRMPYKASIQTPNPAYNLINYKFIWSLELDYDVQYVSVDIKDKYDDELFAGCTLAEIAPSERSFSINLNTIPKNYIFRGVYVSGINFVINNNILFITEIHNKNEEYK